MRVAVCLFGVIARSIRLTWPSVEKHLLLPLRRDGHVVELFGFNLNFNYSIPVDGVILNASGLSVIPFAGLEEERQSDVDVMVDRVCPQLACPTFNAYSQRPSIIRNAFRQLHSEMRVARLLRSSNHDVAARGHRT